MTVKTLSVPCPSCKKQVLLTSESPFRPFCSERCKAIDFGDWATEKNAIPVEENELDRWSEDLDGY